jgi:hypothetical protein
MDQQNTIALETTAPAKRVSLPNPSFPDWHPTFEQWPVSETYRRSAEALITSCVSVLDALGKQGNAEELRQFLSRIESVEAPLSAAALQTIANVRSYLEWFDRKCEKEYANPIKRSKGQLI